MDPAKTKRITEALKRLCDDDRSLILNWLILYYEDDGRMRSPRAKRRSLTLDDVPYYLVRIVRKRHRPEDAGSKGRSHAGDGTDDRVG